MFNFTSSTKPRQQKLPTDPTPASPAPAGAPGTPGNTPASMPAQAAAQPSQPQGMANGSNPYVEQRIEVIEAQRQAFASKNPDFDMKTEMQNPAFVNYVWGNNLSVEDAFFLVHRDELLEQAKAEAMEELVNRRGRIQENGAGKNRPAIAKKNPKDLSDKEIDNIIERARSGEKISF